MGHEGIAAGELRRQIVGEQRMRAGDVYFRVIVQFRLTAKTFSYANRNQFTVNNYYADFAKSSLHQHT